MWIFDNVIICVVEISLNTYIVNIVQVKFYKFLREWISTFSNLKIAVCGVSMACADKIKYFDPDSNVPVKEEVPLHPKPGLIYIYKPPDDKPNSAQDWRSDGYRWRQNAKNFNDIILNFKSDLGEISLQNFRNMQLRALFIQAKCSFGTRETILSL